MKLPFRSGQPGPHARRPGPHALTRMRSQWRDRLLQSTRRLDFDLERLLWREAGRAGVSSCWCVITNALRPLREERRKR